MAIGRCPTSGEACNFIDPFPGEGYEMPAFTELCKKRDEVKDGEFTRFCGRYVQMAQMMVAEAAARGEQ